MLRWSAENSQLDFNPASVGDPTVDSGIRGGFGLSALVDAVLFGTEDDRVSARSQIVEELGVEQLVSAAATLGNFEMMNRIAEGTGIRIPDSRRAAANDWQNKLGLDRFEKHGQ